MAADPRPQRFGNQNGQNVLGENDVREIRRATSAGEGKKSIARRLGVSPTTVLRVRRGLTWAWLA